jgi:hypothetical protein
VATSRLLLASSLLLATLLASSLLLATLLASSLLLATLLAACSLLPLDLSLLLLPAPPWLLLVLTHHLLDLKVQLAAPHAV